MADQESSAGDEADEETAATDGQDGSAPTETIGLGEAKTRARETAEQLLEHDFEGVIKIGATGDGGWRTVVELVERDAVPDTQDIIGRYEITLDETGSTTGYELLERYRRGETKEEL